MLLLPQEPKLSSHIPLQNSAYSNPAGTHSQPSKSLLNLQAGRPTKPGDAVALAQSRAPSPQDPAVPRVARPKARAPGCAAGGRRRLPTRGRPPLPPPLTAALPAKDAGSVTPPCPRLSSPHRLLSPPSGLRRHTAARAPRQRLRRTPPAPASAGPPAARPTAAAPAPRPPQP